MLKDKNFMDINQDDLNTFNFTNAKQRPFNVFKDGPSKIEDNRPSH